MRVALLIALFTAELCAQGVALPRSQGPIVGFVNGPAPLEVTPILGIAAAALLGEPTTAPAGSTRLYLPPGQQYALLERQAGAGMQIWSLRDSSAAQTVAGSMAHADIAVFSPRGTAAALYSKALGRMQVLAGLPAMAVVKSQMATPSGDVISSLCVSDDGAIILARNSAGEIYLWSGGAGWRLMPWSYAPLAWSFIASSHDLAMTLTERQAPGILLFPQVDGPNSAPETLAADFGTLDLLATTRDGADLIAADTVTGRIWCITLQTAATRSVSAVGGLSSLSTLRDGHTFFLSLSNNSSFSLLKVANGSAEPVVLVHPGKSEGQVGAGH